ncbi:hypothetical protein R6Q57_016519 [Mikania cordata]
MFGSSSMQSFSFFLLLHISFVHIFSSFSGPLVSYKQSLKRESDSDSAFTLLKEGGHQTKGENSSGNFVSEQKSRFQVVFDRLRINPYSIDWSEVIDKKDLSKPLRFFLSKLLLFLSNSLPFLFVSFRNIPIHRSEIYIYELKGPNDPQFLESIGLQIVHLKKLKPFILDDHETCQKSKFLINGGTVSPFLFNKIPKWYESGFLFLRNQSSHLRSTSSGALIERIYFYGKIEHLAEVFARAFQANLWLFKDSFMHYVRYQGKSILASKGTFLLMNKWKSYFVNFWKSYFDLWSQPGRIYIFNIQVD